MTTRSNHTNHSNTSTKFTSKSQALNKAYNLSLKYDDSVLVIQIENWDEECLEYHVVFASEYISELTDNIIAEYYDGELC